MTACILRPYQRDAYAAIIAAFRNGQHRVLMVMPTGAGKTVTFGAVIADCVTAGGRALVLAHREELITQAEERIRAMVPDIVTIGVVQAKRDESDADIVVASVQTLCSPARLDRIGPVDLIVVDEAHHSVAASYRTILDRLGALGQSPIHILGVTATPDRGDGMGLGDIFESTAFEIGILPLIEQGHLANIRGRRIMLDRLALDRVSRRAGDFADGALGSAMAKANAPSVIARAIDRYAGDRRSIVFLPTVELARQTAASINARDIPAAFVSGNTPRAERHRIMAQVRSGDTRAVCNALLLTEGVDIPELDCAVMARPTQSSVLYRQAVGRILRPALGKAEALVLDLIGASSRHQLQSAASLFASEPGLADLELRDDETATAAIARHRKEQMLAETGTLVAVDIDLLAERPLNWVASPGGLMVLDTIGTAFVVRECSDSAFELYRCDKGLRGYETRRLLQGVSMAEALGRAEHNAALAGVAHSARRTTAWRSHPATDVQRGMLWRLGVRNRETLLAIETKGEASDLISGLQMDRVLAPVINVNRAA